MTDIATESIEWCIERCKREPNHFWQIAEMQLTALKEKNEGLKKAAIEVINTLRLCEAIPSWPPEHGRAWRDHREAITRLRDALGQEEDKIDQHPTGTPDFEFLLKANKDLYDLAVRRLPDCTLPGCLVCAENKEVLKTAAKAIHQMEEVHYE